MTGQPEAGLNQKGLGRAGLAWVAAQGFRDPYVIVIAIYIFIPWFVRSVVGDPVEGQALIGQGGLWGGVAVMLTMPLLGAVVDRMGPRKPGLALVVAAMAAICCSLWFVTPIGHPQAMLGVTYVIVAGASMSWLIAAHEMLHNALLLPAVGPSGAARASGAGLAAGNGISVLLLLLLLFAFALPGTIDLPFLPAQPLLGLDPALGEPSRIAGPIVGVLMALGSVPLFLLVRDQPRSGASIARAVVGGALDLARLFRNVRGNANPLLYLLARMIFTDGLTAILLFGGIFASGVMAWGTLEMLGYGLLLSMAAVAGGLLAGRMDMAIGPRPALMLQLLGLIGLEFAVIGCDRSHIAHFAISPAPVWSSPIFATAPELAFLALGCSLAICVTAAYASSRTLLTRVAPAEQMGAFFGLYALSGSATMWLGPLLVAMATRAVGTQAAGFWPVIGLLTVGLVLLAFVKGGGKLKA
jgi:UMF1 family MFS transporter